MSEKLKQILKLGGAYGLGNIYHQVLMLLVIPIYTEYLSTEDYGIAGLMSITAALILSFTRTPASYALTRYYYAPGYESKRGELLFGTAIFAILQSSIIAILFYLFASSFSEMILDSASYQNIVKIYSIIILLQPLEVLFTDLLKLQKRAKLLTIMHILNISISVAITLVMLLVYDYKVMSLIIGALSITVFTVIYLLPSVLKNIKFKIDLQLLKPALKFGFPMLLAVIALYSMKNIDMYIVKSLLDVSESGKYHFGYKFGALINYFFMIPLKSIIEPMIYELENEKERLIKFVSDTGTYFFASGMILCLGLSLFSEELLMILASKPEFESAWIIIPVISLAYVNFGMMDIFGNGVIMSKKAFNFGVIYLIGAFLNIGMNYLLIPEIGIMGAAIATLISYIFISVVSSVFSKKYYQQTFEWSKILIVLLTALSIYLISLLFNLEMPFLIFVKIILFLLFIVIIYRLVLNNKQRSELLTILNSSFNKLKK